MLARRPFGSDERLHQLAGEEWFALAPDDWLEAFRHHPKIGERGSLQARSAAGSLAHAEQSGISGASDETLDALAEANRVYEARFGFIFIVCATGKSAGEMLTLLRTRLRNDAQTELQIAAEEQAKITSLRLRRR
jgi:2-oxo-4-hydroxy-4-carboxy-5-ureidoimidazoline decarboxylase